MDSTYLSITFKKRKPSPINVKSFRGALKLHLLGVCDTIPSDFEEKTQAHNPAQTQSRHAEPSISKKLSPSEDSLIGSFEACLSGFTAG